MKFELKFDREIYKKQMDLLFDLAWQQKVTYYKNSQYLGFILFVFGAYLQFEKPSFFNFGIMMVGICILTSFFYYYFKIKSQHKGFENVKRKIGKSVHQGFSTIEFSEKSLKIEVENSIKELNWNEFISYRIYKNNLFMFTKKYEPIILGEIKVGSENLKNIINYIADKIPKIN